MVAWHTHAMQPLKPTPTVLQLVVDDVLLSYLNVLAVADFSECLGQALNLGSTLGQMQEAARIDDEPRVLELLPWLVSSLDCMNGDLLAEWLETADLVRRAALGAPVKLLPKWVAEKQEWVQQHGWPPLGSSRPYDKIRASAPKSNKPHLRLVANNA